MTSATSNIRYTFSGKYFIKDVLMQMTVRMTLQLRGSRPKKTEDKQGKRKGKKAGSGKRHLFEYTYVLCWRPHAVCDIQINEGYRI